MAFSKIVDEILQLLGEAKGVAPIKEDEESSTTATEPTVSPEIPDTAENRSMQALSLKESFQKRLSKDPAGADAAQSKRLETLRMVFTNNYSGNPDLERLKSIQSNYATLLAAYTEVVREIAQARELANRKEELAKRVEALKTVTDATPEDQSSIDTAHGLADAEVKAIDSLEKIPKAEGLVNALAQANAKVVARVKARTEQAARIKVDETAIKNLPEEAYNTFQGERDAVAKWLAIKPPTDESLTKAEGALEALRKAQAAAEPAVKPVREARAAYAIEAQALRGRLKALAEAIPGKVAKEEVTDALEKLANAELFLQVGATKEQTVKDFPAEFAEVKKAVASVAKREARVLTSPQGRACASYLTKELELLEAEMAKLPKSGSFAPFAKAAEKSRSDANRKLNAKTGGQTQKAFIDVEDLGATIASWIEAAGELGARRNRAQAKLDPPNPKDVLAAFAGELDRIRNEAKVSLAKEPNEVNVTKLEEIVEPFPALHLKATQDAEAAVRVTAAKKILETGDALTKVIAAARPPATVELKKARDAAVPRALLTDIQRDMPRTADMFEALVKRMQDVQAEPKFSEMDKELFAGIEEPVRELAFKLCGPKLIESMRDNEAARKELSAVLTSDGPAITVLLEEAFGGNPKVFERVLADCGAAGMATLARALAGDSAARKSLDGLIEKTPLGANPALLTRLIGEPPKGDASPENEAKRLRQEKNAAGLKSLAENFADADGQAAMNTLLVDCGLDHNPNVLASVVQEGGFESDGAELRKFANAFVGDTPELKGDRAGFARLIKTGGVGDHPKVLGPLAKRAGADGVKQIGGAFTTEEDCENLKQLLDQGGMSGDTQLVGKKHEHPDTLTKVFVDGLGSDGKNLKRFAKAFSGEPGQVKGMLDAWNEYPEGYKDERQPGKQIAQVMGRMTGPVELQISKLQTQFTQNIHTRVPPEKRGAAYRFAPDLASEPAPTSLAVPPNMPNGYELDSSYQGQSLCRRHVAKYFSRATMNDQNTLWPVGTDATELTAQLGNAITANSTAGKTMPGNDPVGRANRNKRTVDIDGGKKAEFAAQSYDGGVTFKINHFHPTTGWPQGADPNASVNFPRAEITAMCDAVEVF